MTDIDIYLSKCDFKICSEVITIYPSTSAPGAPLDVTVVNISSNAATVSWNPPTVNPQCVAKYSVEPYPLDGTDIASFAKITLYDDIVVGPDTTSLTYAPLDPCTNYTFHVFGTSHSSQEGPYDSDDGTTEEAAPSDPSDFQLVPTGPNSVNASWNVGSMSCVGSYQLCFDDPVSDSVNCTDVDPSGPGGPSGPNGRQWWEIDVRKSKFSHFLLQLFNVISLYSI